jgi:hypothetical protein
MKQKDIALIIVVIVISVIAALFISKAFLATPKQRSQTVEKVEPIVADFPQPDKRYFNPNSINPTALIRIGDKTNPTPFNTTQP